MCCLPEMPPLVLGLCRCVVCALENRCKTKILCIEYATKTEIKNITTQPNREPAKSPQAAITENERYVYFDSCVQLVTRGSNVVQQTTVADPIKVIFWAASHFGEHQGLRRQFLKETTRKIVQRIVVLVSVKLCRDGCVYAGSVRLETPKLVTSGLSIEVECLFNLS